MVDCVHARHRADNADLLGTLMDHDFWLSRWRDERIGFHESTVNPLLVDHLASLQLDPTSRLFVPLCGKSLDLGWLRAQGHQVVGIELAESAVRAAFEALRETPDVTDLGALKRYRGEAIELFVGDFFDLSAEQLGAVDAIYDRAALIALPMPMRAHYASRLFTLCAGAPQLLITLEYDQSQIDGPPFSVGPEHLRSLYADHYDCEQLLSNHLVKGLKGQVDVTERVWRLKATNSG